MVFEFIVMRGFYFGVNWEMSTPMGLATGRIKTPIGTRCVHCLEHITKDDEGLYVLGHEIDTACMWEVMAIHKECHCRTLIGSLAHVQKKCRCYTSESPVGHITENMTLRQEAIAVWAEHMKEHEAEQAMNQEQQEAQIMMDVLGAHEA